MLSLVCDGCGVALVKYRTQITRYPAEWVFFTGRLHATGEEIDWCGSCTTAAHEGLRERLKERDAG